MRTAFLLLALALTAWAAPAQAQPNVILFLADDMGWRDWEHNGGEHGSTFYETPNLNRLASEGVTFTDAYSSGSTCSPTRGGLMTGKTPARTHLTQWLRGTEDPSNLGEPDWSPGISAEEVTIAEAFRDGGYTTGIIGKWHLGLEGTEADDPLLHGFDSKIANNQWRSWNGYFADADGSFGLVGLGPGTSAPGAYLTDRLTEIAVEFITQNAGGEEPFFLYMSHWAPHTPRQAPADLIAKYRAKPSSSGHWHATHAAMLERLDASLGGILDTLDTLGIRDDTIILVASDNGGDHFVTTSFPLRAGKGSMLEGGIRVPLIVSWTGNALITPSTENESVVTTHDIYPTLLDLTGVPGDASHNQRLDGASFGAALEGEVVDPGSAFWHYPHTILPTLAGRDGRFISAVRDGDWKALFFYEDESWELYNLADDLSESSNLVDTHPAEAHRLGNLMVDWLVDTDAQMPIDMATEEPVPLPVPVPEPSPLLASAVSLAAISLLHAAGRRRSRS